MIFSLKILHFDTYEDLACDVLDKHDALDDKYGDISIIAKYDEAKEIIKKLLCIGYNIASIDLHKPEYCNYFDEYFISLNFDGIWCEKAKNGNEYYNYESNIIYILDNCSSKVIDHCISTFKYEVRVGDDEYEDEMGNEDDIHGFTMSTTDDNGYRSFSYYTTNLLTEEDIQNMIEKMGFLFLSSV